MRDSLRLYGRFAVICLRSKLQYRSSFILLSLGQLFSLFMEYVAVWALFARFGNLKGWTLPEIALFYGVIHSSFAIAEIVGRGFDTFPDLIKHGEFDRYLLRPCSAALQVSGREFDGRIGRLVQAVIIFGWAVHSLPIAWTPPELLLLACMLFGGICLFYGLFVLQATLSFWTVEGLEVMNAVTYGGTETAQYPLSIYRGWFRGIFTFIVPLACINFFPGSLLLGRLSASGLPGLLICLSPLAGLLFLLISLWFWQFGVRRYCSTGS